MTDATMHSVASWCKVTVVTVWLENVEFALGLLLDAAWVLSGSYHVSEVLAAS